MLVFFIIVIILAALIYAKISSKSINDYFADAVLVYLFESDQVAKFAALAAAKTAAGAQRESMLIYISSLIGDMRRESGATDDDLKNLIELRDAISEKDWSIQDARIAKAQLSELDPEATAALNKSKGKYFKYKHPSIFKDTARKKPIKFFKYIPPALGLLAIIATGSPIAAGVVIAVFYGVSTNIGTLIAFLTILAAASTVVGFLLGKSYGWAAFLTFSFLIGYDIFSNRAQGLSSFFENDAYFRKIRNFILYPSIFIFALLLGIAPTAMRVSDIAKDIVKEHQLKD